MSRFTMRGCVLGCGVFCCFCLCLCTVDAQSPRDCLAEIRFPSLNVSLDDDNTPTTVHFEVVSKCNVDLGQYRLDIRRSDGSHPDMSSLEGTRLCTIRHGELGDGCGGLCNQTARGLSCGATETFPRRPHRTWRVVGNNNIIAKTAVFNVSYPTIVTDFDIPHLKGRENTYQAKKGDPFQFVCRWEEGNPLRQIVLRGPGNKALKETSTSPGWSTYLRHTIRSDCSASGQYRCEVEGTSQFKNVTLLVKCPLKFNGGYKSPQRRVQKGRDAIFTFNVTSYTTDFTSCELTTPSGTPVNCTGNAKSEVTVRGSPPNFDVIVRVKNFTEEDEGTWTLTAANGEGNGTVSFGLSVYKLAWTFSDHNTILQNVQMGMDAVINFSVASHTTDVTSCQLTTPSGVPTDCNTGKSAVTVSGSPLHFYVIVTLNDVREQDMGIWKLTASNEEGADAVLFQLSSVAPEVDFLSHPGVVVAMCVACDLVIVAVVIICLWRRQWKLPCAEPPALAAPSAQPVTTSDDDVDAASRGFVEPDSPDYVEPDSPERKTSSNDYLEPIPSADEYLEPTARREEPAGPYESLQMADVGVRSIYSEITSLGRPRLA